MQQVKIIYFDDISGARQEQFEAGPYMPDKAAEVAGGLAKMGAHDIKLIPYNERVAA